MKTNVVTNRFINTNPHNRKVVNPCFNWGVMELLLLHSSSSHGDMFVTFDIMVTMFVNYLKEKIIWVNLYIFKKQSKMFKGKNSSRSHINFFISKWNFEKRLRLIREGTKMHVLILFSENPIKLKNLLVLENVSW